MILASFCLHRARLIDALDCQIVIDSYPNTFLAAKAELAIELQDFWLELGFAFLESSN